MSTTDDDHEWRAGTASEVITPEESMRMAGFGAREEPSEGTLQDLHAKAIALEDENGTRFVAVGVEILAISRPLHAAVTDACEDRYDLPASNLLLNASHTHCGPVYRERKTEVFSLNDEERAQARAYAAYLEETLIDLVGEALATLSPASVTYSHARCGIAMNRRIPLEQGIGFQPYPDGPVDHDVPVLAIESPDDEMLRGILFGYACHPTSLFIREWAGDWAGYAMEHLEEEYPDATAVFVQGCGGDQKAYPQRDLELTKHYGKSLATAVRGALVAKRREVHGPLRCVKEEVDLEFEEPPSREELEAQLESEERYERRHAEHLLAELDEHGELPRTHPYPIQAIGFGGDLTMVALTGEVLVGYSLKLKERLPGSLWVAGYSNNYMTYIPTVDDLFAGGYEADRFVHLTELPAKFDHSVEDRVLSTATALARRVGPPDER
ncbi:neutral/alkaline non-lysosomal ceramidase N-terminal domain-containing protein [Natronosalvus caseinilyticus]|uniref:neutral/alkaline non-lysosomal ceramidase N-terminal domain-containing protein n=1 Tax=Natronosalvus caseinilyticus TaxID=2953747 RepID=UPI0028AEF214|nr:neutral/alkaline non-lysosomal ceramidase N-terminal domain-containing protein [Natronosalvus caseinilyticus]